MSLRPCLDCGRLSQAARCPDHRRIRQAAYDAAKRERRRVPNAERERRAAAVRAWVEEYGWLCPGLPPDHAAHPCLDLTADHVHPVALGGDEDGELRVLCRSINSSLGGRIRQRAGGAG